jgi:hypothetical protein
MRSGQPQSVSIHGRTTGMKTAELYYPVAWEAQYRQTGNVAVWLMDYPDLFPRHVLERRGRLSANPGTLDLFAQYTLQFLLRGMSR